MTSAKLHGNGDGGDSEECSFKRGGDCSGIDCIDAAVCTCVHAADDEIRSRIGTVFFGPETFYTELYAIGGTTIDGGAGHEFADTNDFGHEWLVESDTMGGGALNGERGHDID